MNARRGLAAAATLAIAASAQADPPPPAACLPPRRESCEPHAKKDERATRATPVLRAPIATLFHVHTREAVTLEVEPRQDEEALLARFFRDRTSWEEHAIAPECVATVRAACSALGARRVEVVSGFRSDKLNEMLRKKGRQVARRSEHSQGHAVDFRLVGVPTRALRQFVGATHHGGIGFYAGSGFVHVDVGRPRTWTGE